MTTFSVINLILVLVVMAVIGYQHVEIRRLKNDMEDLKEDREWLLHEVQRLKRPGGKRVPPPRSFPHPEKDA